MSPLAVDRLTQRVDHAAEEGVADGHREHLAGALDLLALFDLLEVTEDHRADAVLVEVERNTEHAAGELQQLLRHHRRQALDVRDAVAGVDDGADLLALGVGLEAGDILLDGALDLSPPRSSTLPWLFVFLLRVWVLVLSGSVGQVGLGRASLDASEPSITSSPTAIVQAAEQRRVDVQLKRHGMTVDAGEHLGEPVALSVAELACGAARVRRPRHAGTPRDSPVRGRPRRRARRAAVRSSGAADPRCSCSPCA